MGQLVNIYSKFNLLKVDLVKASCLRTV